MPSVEVTDPKTINIKQYLNTNNLSVNNINVVIKSSQATQLCITKVFHNKSSCHGCIENNFSSEIFIKLTFSDSVQSHD